MKTKKHFLKFALLAAGFALLPSFSFAQWAIGGNNIGVNDYLGCNIGTNTNPIILKTSTGTVSTERMRIMGGANGYVGINMTAPSQRLSVGGAIGWGSGTTCTSQLTNDQNGAIELGALNNTANPSGTPYFDFHYGNNTVQDYNFRLINQNDKRLDFVPSTAIPSMSIVNDKIGINNTNPQYRLHVDGDVFITGNSNNAALFFGDLNTQANWSIEYDAGGGGMNFWKPSGSVGGFANYQLFLKNNGNVGINTSNATAKLTVNGNMLIGDPATTLPGTYGLYVQNGILTNKVRVADPTTGYWADYVFAPNYKLRPLSEVDNFIKTNQHLPEVPSACDVEENGIDVFEMNATLLKKVEELTLYIIDQDKRIQALEEKAAPAAQK